MACLTDIKFHCMYMNLCYMALPIAGISNNGIAILHYVNCRIW